MTLTIRFQTGLPLNNADGVVRDARSVAQSKYDADVPHHRHARLVSEAGTTQNGASQWNRGRLSSRNSILVGAVRYVGVRQRAFWSQAVMRLDLAFRSLGVSR